MKGIKIMQSKNNSIFYMLAVIVLLLIGGPLLLAGGGLVFLGFLLIVGIVTVIVNVISKKEEDKKRELRLKKERIDRQNQEDQRQKEREEKEKERKTTAQNIEKSKDYILLAKESQSDNYRAAAVLNAVQENIYLLQPTNVNSQAHLKGKHKVIEQKILKIDSSLFQFLVDYRTKNLHDDSLPPMGFVGSDSSAGLGEVDADYTSPIFNQLGADFTPTALKFDGRNLMYLPPLERSEEYCEMAFASNPEAIKHMPKFSVFLMKLKKSDPDLVTEYIQDTDDYMYSYIKQKYHRYFENDNPSQFALEWFHEQFPKVIKELENIPDYKSYVNRFMWEECVNFIDNLSENDFQRISIDKFMQGFPSYWQPVFTLDELKSYFDRKEEQFDYL